MMETLFFNFKDFNGDNSLDSENKIRFISWDFTTPLACFDHILSMLLSSTLSGETDQTHSAHSAKPTDSAFHLQD